MIESDRTKAAAVKLREFFRLCGVIVNYQEHLEDNDQIVVDVYDTKMRKKPKRVFLKDVSKKEVNKLVGDFFANFSNSDKSYDEDLQQIFQQIETIFTENKLEYAIYNMAHFHKIRAVLEESVNGFIHAYVELLILINNYKAEGLSKRKLYYLVYAKVFCAQKVNEICGLLGRSKSFRIDILVKELKRVMIGDFREVSGNYLIGQLYSYDIEQRYIANLYYHDAIDEEIMGQFASGIYYKMGVNEQAVTGKRNKYVAWYHKKALESNENCYRSMYQLGMYYLKKDEKKTAEGYFQRIIKCLNRSLKFLQPLEITYLFKAFERLRSCTLLPDIDNYEKEAININAEILLKAPWVGEGFLIEFYGEQAGQYAEYLHDCLDAVRMYDYY